MGPLTAEMQKTAGESFCVSVCALSNTNELLLEKPRSVLGDL